MARSQSVLRCRVDSLEASPSLSFGLVLNIVQKPDYLVYTHIMVIYNKFLNTNPVIGSAKHRKSSGARPRGSVARFGRGSASCCWV